MYNYDDKSLNEEAGAFDSQILERVKMVIYQIYEQTKSADSFTTFGGTPGLCKTGLW